VTSGSLGLCSRLADRKLAYRLSQNVLVQKYPRLGDFAHGLKALTLRIRAGFISKSLDAQKFPFSLLQLECTDSFRLISVCSLRIEHYLFEQPSISPALLHIANEVPATGGERHDDFSRMVTIIVRFGFCIVVDFQA
jgi:hypothetical protein